MRIDDLRTIVNLIFNYIEDDLGIFEVELSENYYWDAPDDALYSVDKKLDAFDVGSLYDDLEFLTPLLDNSDEAFALMLVHVAPLLRYIAKKVGE